jgi:hypothetical protein
MAYPQNGEQLWSAGSKPSVESFGTLGVPWTKTPEFKQMVDRSKNLVMGVMGGMPNDRGLSYSLAGSLSKHLGGKPEPALVANILYKRIGAGEVKADELHKILVNFLKNRVPEPIVKNIVDDTFNRMADFGRVSITNTNPFKRSWGEFINPK